MLRSTAVLPADHSARTLTRTLARPHPQSGAPAALWRRAGSAVVALLGRWAARAETGVDHRDGEATHRIWRDAAVGGGPGLR